MDTHADALAFLRQHDPKRARTFRAADSTVRVMRRCYGRGVYGTKVVGYNESWVDVCEAAAYCKASLAKSANACAGELASARKRLALAAAIVTDANQLISDLAADLDGLTPEQGARMSARAETRRDAAQKDVTWLTQVVADFVERGW